MIFQRGHFHATRIQKSNLNEALNEVRTFSAGRTENKPTVFLSHKHSDLGDEEEVKGIIELLEDLGAKVYIDSMDNSMPGTTCGDTAVRIKDLIKHCNKFILVATSKAIESYWCNWELGIGDTYRYIDHIAVVPIKERGQFDSQYKGNEYLQIYPQIDYRDGTTRDVNTKRIEAGYYVCEPRPTGGIRYIESLSQWLNN